MSRSYIRRRGERSSEDGSIVVMTALFMALLFVMVGLCIDVSRIYMVRTELQNAADAAALSAARELNSGTTGINSAVTRANEVVNTYGFGKTNVGIFSVEFAVNLNDDPYMSAAAATANAAIPPTIRFVKVTTQSTSTSIIFAIGALTDPSCTPGPCRSQTRNAVAGMSPGLNTICDFFPVAVALTDASANPGFQLPAANSLMTLNFTQGSGSSATLHNQDFIILEVPDINGNGAPETAVLSAGVTNLCQSIGANITFHMTPSANQNNGPVQITDGANTRFDIRANGYGNALKSTLSDGTYAFKPDTNIRPDISFDQYKNGTAVTPPGTTGADDRRILLVPIVKLTTSPQSFGTQAPVETFGAFFMRRRIADPDNPCTQAGHICGRLEVEWIDENLMVGSGGVVPGGGSSSLTVPVLYR